jgi:hypothetical protein
LLNCRRRCARRSAGDTLDIDLTSQAFMRDPLPTLARLREAGPVVRVKLPS